MRVENDEQTDDLLLQQYLQSRSEEAFGVLVRRYGQMVWGVCRRILRHTQDAEDAFQATFAVLSRKARSIRRKQTIGAWLHQVARRIALRERAVSIRRITVMPGSIGIAVAEPAGGNDTVDVHDILDDEIANLPTLLRLPIVLCYLEGLTNFEAAKRLGCPEGTIVSRLARGRAKLRYGLTRRGVVLGGVAAVTALVAEIGVAAPLLPELSNAALACCRVPVTGSISGGSVLTAGATRLATEALRSMRLRSLAGSGAITLCSALGILAVVWFVLGRGLPLGGFVQNGALGQFADLNSSIQGIWQGEDLEFIGGDTPDERAERSRDCRWVITGKIIRFKWQDETVFSANFHLDSSSKPSGIDIRPTDLPTMLTGETLHGAFKLEQTSLEVCTAERGGARPGFVRIGLVARLAVHEPEVRAGLVGYCRLRRLVRSFEVEELQGKWVLEHMEADGNVFPLDDQRRQGARFDDGKYTFYHVRDGNVLEIPGTFSLDAAQPARFMELRPQQGQPFSCLYEIQGETLRLVGAAPGAPRPEEFKTEPAQMHTSWVFRRVKPAAAEAPRADPP